MGLPVAVVNLSWESVFGRVRKVSVAELLRKRAMRSMYHWLSLFYFEPLLPFIRLTVDRPRLTLPGCRTLRAAF